MLTRYYLKKSKIVFLMLFMVAQAAGLYAFYLHQGPVLNFQTPYVTSVYVPAYMRIFGNLLGLESQANAISPQQKAKSVPVLVYHGLVTEDDGFNLPLSEFRKHMFALKNAGYQTVSIKDFYLWKRGLKQLPDKSFLITFDDGRKDSYYPVDPILRAAGFRATMFAISVHSPHESGYYLNEKELKEMSDSGRWDIQSHGGLNHDLYSIDKKGKLGSYISDRLWLKKEKRLETKEEGIKRYYKDIKSARDYFKGITNKEIIGYAYPRGDFGQKEVNNPGAEKRVVSAAKKLYGISFYQPWNEFTYNYPHYNDFMARRIMVEPDWDATRLTTELDNANDKALPYIDRFDRNKGWMKRWGNMRVNKNLTIAPDTATSGEAMLNGSYLWRKYNVAGKYKLLKGQSFSIKGYFKDDKNYMAAILDKDMVRIDEVVKGKEQNLVKKKIKYDMHKKAITVNWRLDGKTAALYINNRLLVSAPMNPSLKHGGITIQTWDPKIKTAKLEVSKLAVVSTTLSNDSFNDDFNENGVLEEAWGELKSQSTFWWLSSGALFTKNNGIGSTNQGKLSELSNWRLIYANSNPLDTEGGYYPQNIFRLYTRSKWKNYAQQVFFKINNINKSASPNRNESNGLFLMNRAKDSNNLYYAGIRIDGKAVIKKKIKGKYHTLAIKKIFNSIPEDKWMGIKSQVENSNNEVQLKLSVTNDRGANWVEVLQVRDRGKNGRVLSEEGRAGIRSDFMDVEFDDYNISNITLVNVKKVLAEFVDGISSIAGNDEDAVQKQGIIRVFSSIPDPAPAPAKRYQPPVRKRKPVLPITEPIRLFPPISNPNDDPKSDPSPGVPAPTPTPKKPAPAPVSTPISAPAPVSTPQKPPSNPPAAVQPQPPSDNPADADNGNGKEKKNGNNGNHSNNGRNPGKNKAN